MKVSREFKCCAGSCRLCIGCCEACQNEIVVEAPIGTVIGYIKQKYII